MKNRVDINLILQSKEMEAQRGKETCLRSYHYWRAKLEWESKENSLEKFANSYLIFAMILTDFMDLSL